MGRKGGTSKAIEETVFCLPCRALGVGLASSVEKPTGFGWLAG